MQHVVYVCMYVCMYVAQLWHTHNCAQFCWAVGCAAQLWHVECSMQQWSMRVHAVWFCAGSGVEGGTCLWENTGLHV